MVLRARFCGPAHKMRCNCFTCSWWPCYCCDSHAWLWCSPVSAVGRFGSKNSAVGCPPPRPFELSQDRAISLMLMICWRVAYWESQIFHPPLFQIQAHQVFVPTNQNKGTSTCKWSNWYISPPWVLQLQNWNLLRISSARRTWSSVWTHHLLNWFQKINKYVLLLLLIDLV